MLTILLVLLIVFIIYKRNTYHVTDKPTIDINGYEVISIFTENEVNLLLEYAEHDENKKASDYVRNSQKVIEAKNRVLGTDYVFADYSFILKKSQLSSCHRDDNGTMINKDSQYPSYTIIVFLKSMENCLKVIDKSHTKQEGFYFTQPPEDIKCTPGQMIIFDSNLVHAGAFNKNINNTRIQMKLVHHNDIENHPELKNFHKELKNDNKPTHFAKMIDQPISCIAPVIADSFRFEKGPGARLYEKLIYKNNLNL